MQTQTPTLFGRITAVQRDHTALIEMISRLRELQSTLSEMDDCTPIRPLHLIQDFALQLYGHFAAEEALMDQYAIVDRATHKQSHRRLLQDVMSLATMSCSASMTLSAGFLHEWLIRHVDSADRALARQLLAKGYSEGNPSIRRGAVTPPGARVPARR